ncbi:MAG TPA: glycosyl transferase, partial [Acidiphilium sp.]
GATLAAAGAASRATRKWLPAAAALGGLMTAFVYAQAIAAPIPLPARRDPTALQLAGWSHLATGVARAARADNARFVTGSSYAITAELAYALPPDITVIGVGERWRYFNLPGLMPSADRTGLLVEPQGRKPLTDEGFGPATPIGSIARQRDGRTIRVYDLYRIGLKSSAPVAIVKDAR